MSRFLSSAALAALTAAAACAVAGAASAQSYGRLVVFGDSLSDNGNLYAATAGASPTSPPYFQGRFSNGPVFTELLGFTVGRSALGAPVTGSTNYAYGGARSDSSAFPPGMRNQLLAYTGAGGTFGSRDLVSILGGANNLLQGVPVAAGAVNPTGVLGAMAVSSAADITFITNSVASRGAGTILVSNLPQLSLTPQFNQGAGLPAAPLADYGASTFNGALLTGLMTTAAANPNTNIIMMDLFKVGAVISANPGAFGLTNVRDTCFNGLTVCATPGTYFYWDTVHPTAAGHRLLAALSNDYLYYGDIGAQSTVQGETAFRQREDMLDLSSEAVSGHAAWEPGTRLIVGALTDSVTTDARGSVAETEADGWGARVGIDHVSSPNWRVGLAGSYRSTDVAAGKMSFEQLSYGFDVYAGWREGNMFANATAGAAIEKYDDIERITSLAPIVHTGQADGGSLGARVQTGVWYDMGGIAISPRVAVTWVKTTVNAYNETGAAAEYAYQKRELQGVSGEVSLRAEGGGEGMSFYAEGGYRDGLSDSFDPVRVGIAGNSARILERQFEDPFGGSFLASAGLETHMGPVRISAGYRGRFGDKAESHSGALTFSLPL
ncbi:autotransporter domain-containing protein [uncultured Brevundimonas sp.]|uniref:autotransporter domain-containing protein n=1 Tax=uncultured Brevundimonas sp. TaxID=213418 RepID=UPI0030EF1FBE|tara:strand:- start:589 stop:2409 length:1821 start_codon:yes stop_codon:yes gene_type:complete